MLTKTTQILTNNGFKNIENINANDMIATVDINNDCIFLKDYTITKEKYVGDIYHIESTNRKYLNHKSTYNQLFSINADGKYCLSNVGDAKTKHVCSTTIKQNGIKFTDLHALQVAFQADGCLMKQNFKDSSKRICFSLKKKSKINRLKTLLESI